ncbi:MAG: glycosyltransferase family 2 protein [Bacteroidales bacterium]|nr:glycosyltransferase family 2 protein [Bacteroidales bacterium]
MTKKKVTVLIPCYNEQESLPYLKREIDKLINSYDLYNWEILFVNDGSSDATIDIIKSFRKEDKRYCYIDLSRNFGKEAAMLAGFDYAKGDCMIIMDADMQHPPALIPEMLKHWEEGFEDVYAKRKSRGKESWLRKKLSLQYYRLLQKTTRVEILQNVGDFRLLDRKCIDALRLFRESNRYTKGMFCLIGFKKKEILFEQQDRVAGSSSWNFKSLVGLAVDGITSFTSLPLRFATFVGLLVSLGAFGYMCFIIAKTLIWGESIQGFPTLITVILFSVGLQFLFLGIIGEYLGRIFYETKNRPVYIIKSYNEEENNKQL